MQVWLIFVWFYDGCCDFAGVARAHASATEVRVPSSAATSRALKVVAVLLALLATGVPEAHARLVPSRARPPAELTEDARAALSRALDAYEEARGMLARDEVSGLRDPATALATSLAEAKDALGGRDSRRERLSDAISAADALAASTDLEEARRQFAKLSEALTGAVRADRLLTEGRRLFYCPEAEARWIQRSPDPENPYLGAANPTCGRASGWKR
ncbi:MAG: hypothetical protein ACOZNI_22150 [Myxococcota bacterium]